MPVGDTTSPGVETTTTTTTTTTTVPQGSGGVLWMVVWLVLLILVVMFVSGWVAFLYVAVIPFSVCVPSLAYVTDFLLLLVQMPHYCAHNMMAQNTAHEAAPLFGSLRPPTIQSMA